MHYNVNDRCLVEVLNAMEKEGEVFIEAPTREERLAVLDALTKDPLAADLVWTLFRAACEDYRFDSLLRPCPAPFVNFYGEKKILKLRTLAASVTSFEELIPRVEADRVDPQLMFLLHWVLVDHSFRLRTVRKSEFQCILKKVQGTNNATCRPNLMFEVDKIGTENQFEELRRQWGGASTFAFHGSRLENFHSILHNGLEKSREKIGAYGRGIYLSTELAFSVLYSPTGTGWGGSALGGALSVVALCEMIHHEDVKCHGGNQSMNSNSRRSRSKDDEIPKGYFLVKNSPLVRVTHLLVYSTRRTGATPWSQFLLFLILAYFVLLLIMSFYNSSWLKIVLKGWFV